MFTLKLRFSAFETDYASAVYHSETLMYGLTLLYFSYYHTLAICNNDKIILLTGMLLVSHNIYLTLYLLILNVSDEVDY